MRASAHRVKSPVITASEKLVVFYLSNFTTMRFVKGGTLRHYPRTASITFTKGDLVMLTSGLVATATAQSETHLGIIQEDVTSGDSNFATAAVKVSVKVPKSLTDEIEATVTGTLATTSIGLTYDLNSASVVNQGGTTYGVMECVGFISSTKGRFKLISSEAVSDPAGI